MTDYKLMPAELKELLTSMVKLHESKDTVLTVHMHQLREMLASAPVVPVEPVGWQYYQFGKWWPGDTLTREQQNDIKEAGHPIRSVYATPQPVEQQPTTCAVCGQSNVSYIDGVGASRRSPTDCRDGVRYITVEDTVYWPLSDEDAQLLRSAACGKGEFNGPAISSPDVVEALELMVKTHEEGGWPTAAITIAHAALAAHFKRDSPAGYAGATVWIGDKRVTQVVTEGSLKCESEPGMVITHAAQACLDLLAAAHHKGVES